MHAQPSPDEVDPSQATTRTEFGARLRAQRIAAGLSLRDLETATRSTTPFLAKSTIENAEQSKTLPRVDWLTAYLIVCGVPSSRQRAWRQARARIASSAAGFDTAALRLSKVNRCEPRTEVVYDSPAGLIRATAAVEDGRVTSVAFRNVPAFRYAVGLDLATRAGLVRADVAYGAARTAARPGPRRTRG